MGDSNNTARMVVDSHAHVFLKGLPLASVHRHAPQFDATLEQYIALLDAHGASHAVLVQPSFFGTDNSFMLQAMRAWPHRLRSVVMLDPSTSEQELAQLDAQGVVGVRLNLVGLPMPDLREPQWQAFLSRIAAFDWHLELHRQSADLPTLIDAALQTGVRIVIDHFGRPNAVLGAQDPGFQHLLARADSGHIWVKLSAAYRNSQSALNPAAQRAPALHTKDAANARECAAQLLSAFGPERLVWGSDWPHTQHQDLVDYGSSLAVLNDWVTRAEQREQILGSTPAELFKFTSTP